MKIGLDLHGVSDAYPEFFSTLSKLFVDAGHEVHIMTGELVTDALHEQLEKCNVQYTHLFSILQYHTDKGTTIREDEQGNKWIDDDIWNKAKGDYARQHGLDIVLDDTEVYSEHFTTPFIYCKAFNKLGGRR